MFMRGVTAIEFEWLLVYAKRLCATKLIKEDPQPMYYESNGKYIVVVSQYLADLYEKFHQLKLKCHEADSDAGKYEFILQICFCF